MDTICNPSGILNKTSNTSLSEPPVQKADTNASELFESGLLREALEATAEQIPNCKSDPANALGLWYIRIQSLLILDLKAEATKEINSNLQHIENEEFRTNMLTSPTAKFNGWKLRLLLVPVKTNGINHAAIQQYYFLSFEARQNAADSAGESHNWLGAVELAGTYVISTLIALHDYSTAISVMKAHFEVTKQCRLACWLTLTSIQIGDIPGAKIWLGEVDDLTLYDQLRLLIEYVGDSNEAPVFSGLADVYAGRISKAIDTYESAVKEEKKTGLEKMASKANLTTIRKLMKVT